MLTRNQPSWLDLNLTQKGKRLVYFVFGSLVISDQPPLLAPSIIRTIKAFRSTLGPVHPLDIETSDHIWDGIFAGLAGERGVPKNPVLTNEELAPHDKTIRCIPMHIPFQDPADYDFVKAALTPSSGKSGPNVWGCSLEAACLALITSNDKYMQQWSTPWLDEYSDFLFSNRSLENYYK